MEFRQRVRSWARGAGATALILVLLLSALGACAAGGKPGSTPGLSPTATAGATVVRATPAATMSAPTAAATPERTEAGAVEVRPGGVYTRTGAAGYVDTFVVDPGVDNPTPSPGERIMFRARLLKNGVRVGGMYIRVAWVQGGELQQCDFLPLYQSGCVIDVNGFAPGVFVPVTVTLRYQDMELAGYGGFTPQ